MAERKQQEEAVGDLTQLQAQIVSARSELEALAQKREQAKAQVAAVQQDRTELTKWLEGKRANRSEKGRARAAKTSSKPTQMAAQAKNAAGRRFGGFFDFAILVRFDFPP